MPKYAGVLIKKEYFDIEVEADNIDEARDLISEATIEDEPYDVDWETYDVKEIQNEGA